MSLDPKLECLIWRAGWGNQELQMYQQQNAEVAGGVLAIRADVAPGGGYVSARLAGAPGRAFAPGPGETLRIEARIQLPRGNRWSVSGTHKSVLSTAFLRATCMKVMVLPIQSTLLEYLGG